MQEEVVAQDLKEMLKRLPFTIEETTMAFDPDSYAEGVPLEMRAAILEVATQTVEKAGGIEPTVFILACRADDLATRPKILCSALKDTSERAKGLWVSFLKMMAESTQAVALVHVSEIWHYAGDDREGLRVWQSTHNDSFEGFPGVSERLSVRFECAGKHDLWSADMIRSPDGAIRVGVWENLNYKEVKGRFIGLLPTVNLEDKVT